MTNQICQIGNKNLMKDTADMTSLSLPARKKLIETDLLANFKKRKLVEYKLHNKVHIVAVDYYETKEVKQNQIDYLSQIPLINMNILSETLKKLFLRQTMELMRVKTKTLPESITLRKLIFYFRIRLFLPYSKPQRILLNMALRIIKCPQYLI